MVETAVAVRDDLEQDLANDEVGMLVAELDGRIVDLFEVVITQPAENVVYGHSPTPRSPGRTIGTERR